ncbi:DUF6471 domain-containing protein [Ralstonia mojiangensis]|uniref:DUF6471 domain-containing protein n=1 Tax=Ralstonia mojiangensis TaxID=2953895 RepID=UPI0020919FE8|nr:DUF6471 domain-containing protein [Ralstonia mojiangensis]MCO5411868.1 DUF6471 domain-containing protein [Ralstonia mojiangensis]
MEILYACASKKQGNRLSEEQTPWASLASRVIRVALARGDWSYAQLAAALSNEGVEETERSLISRVSRGTIKFTLLLQAIHLTGGRPPRLWLPALGTPETWESKAQAVLAAELSQRPLVTPRELVDQLARLGTRTTEKTLVAHFSSGTLPLSLFVQCLAVIGSTSLDSYVDFEVLAATVEQCMAAHQG